MGTTVAAEPITVIASWQLEAGMERTGRRALLRARALDELQAPLASQPIVVTWTRPGRDPLSQVYMTDRSGLLVAAWTLDDGHWDWSVTMPDDPFAVTPTVSGSLELGPEQVQFSALQPEIVEAGVAPWTVDLVATTAAGVRARNLPASASLWCAGERLAEQRIVTDAAGRTAWVGETPLGAGNLCEIRVSCDDVETAMTADARVPVRTLGMPVLTGHLESGGGYLGLSTHWSLHAVVADENGQITVGQFEAIQAGERVGLWPASAPGPFELSASTVTPERGPLTVHWNLLPSDTGPRAFTSMTVPVTTGFWWWMIAGGLSVLILAALFRTVGFLWTRYRSGVERRTAGHAAAAATGDTQPGLQVVDADTLLPLAAIIRCGTQTFETTNGRWSAQGTPASDVTVTAPGYESVTVAAALAQTSMRRIILRSWRRMVIDELIGVLVERGIQGANEAWWGRHSPSQIRPDALTAVRGLRVDRDGDASAVDWRCVAAAEPCPPHEALRALFALVDEAAFGPPERLDDSWSVAAARLAGWVRSEPRAEAVP